MQPKHTHTHTRTDITQHKVPL